MENQNSLRQILRRIDKKGYKAYKEIKGQYRFPDFLLFIDHVQGDPFAAPSKIRVRVPMQKAEIPNDLIQHPHRRSGTADAIIRIIHGEIRKIARMRRGTGKSGLISIDVGGQEIIPRSALKITDSFVEARMEIGLPARGRTVLSDEAEAMFFDELPRIIQNSMFRKNFDQEFVTRFAYYVQNYFAVQKQLKSKNLIAFIADRSVLPRESGVSQKPMPINDAVPFRSPRELKVKMELPNPVNGQTFIEGAGIPAGITLIVGGGFHGKSTLLQALESGVYPHIPGDGREYVVTNPAAVKIRAEDGRRIEKVDIRPFINHLPRQKDARSFCTDDASGSTSQAANIIEALETGAEALLVDEDTSATNFMIRDARMQALVHKQFEPITPFIDRIREMYDRFGVSTVLVMGGSGDYFQAADTVILMKEYVPQVVTEQARAIAEQFKTERRPEREFEWKTITERAPLPQSFDASKGKKEVKIEARGLHSVQFGTHTIDLRQVEQIVDISQTRAIGFALHFIARRWMDGQRTIRELMDLAETFLLKEGTDGLNPFRRDDEHPGNFALPRRFEIAAALNRYRGLKVRQKEE
ncbi:MAG: ABC-ATPase domain-containing protein [Calditrichaeota bacterium]|nr:ABC-ATPase domain-containing protein [Calditrichota bacterium]